MSKCVDLLPHILQQSWVFCCDKQAHMKQICKELQSMAEDEGKETVDGRINKMTYKRPFADHI